MVRFTRRVSRFTIRMAGLRFRLLDYPIRMARGNLRVRGRHNRVLGERSERFVTTVLLRRQFTRVFAETFLLHC